MEHWDFDDIVTEFICKNGQVEASVFKQPIDDSLLEKKNKAIDPDGYEYEHNLFDGATEKQLYAFFGVLISIDDENAGNELIFEIEQAIEDYSAGGYACAALPLVSDKESFFNGIEQALMAQS